MGAINAENMLQFRSASELTSRIKNYLSSYNAMGLIDDTQFPDYIREVYRELGDGALQECKALIEIKNKRATLPCNFFQYYATYRCRAHTGQAPSINEQKPWIYYMDTEVSQECPNKCCQECVGTEIGKTKIVIRTFVNGDEDCGSGSWWYNRNDLMTLSPNAAIRCVDNCPCTFRPGCDELTIDSNRNIFVTFDHGTIAMEYLGIPVDADGLPMIPDEPSTEKAIEYYIYTRIFEQLYFNSTVPDIAQKLQYVKGEYALNIEKAKFYFKLPSFQKAIQEIRQQRKLRQFYYFGYDRTITLR